MSVFPTLVRAGEPDAPTLVCLPYFGGSARTYAAVWPLLLPSWNLRAYTPANIGVQADGSYSLDHAFEQLAQAVQSDVEGPFHFVAHSMCGKMALGAASLGIDNLQSIVLLAPSPPSPEPMDESVRQSMLQMHGTRKAALLTVNEASKRPLPPELLEIAVEDNLATNEGDWKNWLELGSCEDRSDILRSVHVPVKIVLGQLDGNMTPTLMKHTIIEPLAALDAPPTELEIVERAGHLLPLEAPQEVANLLSQWCGG